MSARATRDEAIAYSDGPAPTYRTVRVALTAARAAVAEMRSGRQCHYSHATGQYDLTDGRTVEVRLRPAVGGGVLLGVHDYAVWRTLRDPRRWRAL